MKFFKPEDFINSCDYQDMARKANAKLEREGKAVYSKDPFEKSTWVHTLYTIHNSKALLIALEPIVKYDKTNPKHFNDRYKVTLDKIKELIESSEATQICEHPSEKVQTSFPATPFVFKCECGARVTPPKGNWTEVCE